MTNNAVLALRNGVVQSGGAGVEVPTALTGFPVSADYVYVEDITNGWALATKASTTVWSSNVGASLIKWATAYVVMDNYSGSLSTTMTVTAADLVTGTSAGLQENDVISVEDLLYGLMLASGNDAAYTLARVTGDKIYTDAGSTGNQGVTRFVEAMNDLATTLGLSNTTFATPSGVNGAGNVSNAEELTALMKDAITTYSTLETIAGTASHDMTVTGVNARTETVEHTSDMINGPISAPVGETWDNGLASKTGFDASSEYSVQFLWQAPAGQELLFTIVGSQSDITRYWDLQGLIWECQREFAYLTDGTSVGTDAQFANVTFLAGFDSSISDESTTGHSLTASGATRSDTDPIIGTHSALFDGTNDYITAADSTEFEFGSGDYAVEFYFRGDGSAPTGNRVFISKWNTTGNQRSWTVQWSPSTNVLVHFISTTGSNFPQATYTFSTDADVFFNGAIRHIMVRRSGNEFAIFVNGWRSSSGTTLTNSGTLFANTADLYLGCRQAGTGQEFFLPGQLDEVRITKGNARVTGTAFTPTGRPHPRSGP